MNWSKHRIKSENPRFNKQTIATSSETNRIKQFQTKNSSRRRLKGVDKKQGKLRMLSKRVQRCTTKTSYRGYVYTVRLIHASCCR